MKPNVACPSGGLRQRKIQSGARAKKRKRASAFGSVYRQVPELPAVKHPRIFQLI